MRSLEGKLKTLFIVSAVALSFIGLAFVHSAGSYWGTVHYADSSPFIVKQAIYMAVSIGIAIFIMKSPLTSSPKMWTVFYFASDPVTCCSSHTGYWGRAERIAKLDCSWTR